MAAPAIPFCFMVPAKTFFHFAFFHWYRLIRDHTFIHKRRAGFQLAIDTLIQEVSQD
jgi:hypothetical protein